MARQVWLLQWGAVLLLTALGSTQATSLQSCVTTWNVTLGLRGVTTLCHHLRPSTEPWSLISQTAVQGKLRLIICNAEGREQPGCKWLQPEPNSPKPHHAAGIAGRQIKVGLKVGPGCA